MEIIKQRTLFRLYFAIIQGENKNLKVRYDFLTNKATIRCNTSICCFIFWCRHIQNIFYFLRIDFQFLIRYNICTTYGISERPTCHFFRLSFMLKLRVTSRTIINRLLCSSLGQPTSTIMLTPSSSSNFWLIWYWKTSEAEDYQMVNV